MNAADLLDEATRDRAVTILVYLFHGSLQQRLRQRQFKLGQLAPTFKQCVGSPQSLLFIHAADCKARVNEDAAARACFWNVSHEASRTIPPN